MAEASSIAVVIPCMNERAHIARLLLAIADQDPKPNEIVIVDGGSSDGTLEEIERVRPALHDVNLETIVAPELPLPAVVNLAVRRSHAQLIIRLDAHSEPSEGYMRRAKTHLSDHTVGVVGGIWRIDPANPTPMAGAIARAVAHPLGAGDAAYRLGTGMPKDVDTVPFGCFRRETWELTGGLNEHLLGNEDYEFNYRVRQRGLAVRLDPAMQCRYVARSTIGALARQYFRYGWCKVQMLRLHPRALRWRQTIPAAFVATLVVLLGMATWSQMARAALAMFVASYAIVLIAASIGVALREGRAMHAMLMPLVFATIHLMWGSGALVHVLAAGRWPSREFLFGIPSSTALRPRPSK